MFGVTSSENLVLMNTMFPNGRLLYKLKFYRHSKNFKKNAIIGDVFIIHKHSKKTVL